MELRTTPGTLLLAVPQMLDPNFMHTVVLICEHTGDGAFGLIVNRATELSLGQLFEDHATLARSNLPVLEGGPVGRDTLQFVHRMPDVIREGYPVLDGLFLGGALEDLARYVDEDAYAEEHVRLFVGYSGWSAGQLDSELGSGSWVPAPFDADLVFGPAEAESVWRRAMRSLGAEGERLAGLPPDPTWN